MDTTPYSMRPFDDTDLETLIQIVRDHLEEEVTRHIGPWHHSEKMLREEMPAARGDIKVIVEGDGEIVGFVWVTGHDDFLFLDEIHVVETARGAGLGAALMREVEAQAARRGLSRIRLAVFADSPQITFYEHLGFEVVERVVARHQIYMSKSVTS